MTRYKIFCALLAVGLAVSLSREPRIRELCREHSIRARRRAKALADAWTRPLDSQANHPN
jgi:hypothetical protein